MKIKYFFLFIFFLGTNLIFPQSSNYNTNLFEYLSPVPSSSLHLPQTNIIIRQGEILTNVDLNDTTLITVNGSVSGKHSGQLFFTDDSKTLIFEPTLPFTSGENVEVKLKYGIKTITNSVVDSLGFRFNITIGCNNPPNSILISNQSPKNNVRNNIKLIDNFPNVLINNKTTPESGYYFVALNQINTDYIGIINNSGYPIFHRKITGPIYDFKLNPNGILTYYDLDKGKYYGLDSMYQIVDSFFCGNGYPTNFHGMQVLQNGHYFVMAYDPQPVKMDTVVTGGDPTACVIGVVVQELDSNKRVIWQWRSWDNYKITDDLVSDFTQHTIEYSHINSIDVPNDSTVIFSVKHFNEITSVNRKTGNINWRFGGKNNQFTISGDPFTFQFQHDARFLANNKLTLFDNGYQNRSLSRAVIYDINTLSKSASLSKEFYHNPNLWSRVMGNMQFTSNGNFVIGWGHTNTSSSTSFITEYDNLGVLTNDITIIGQNNLFNYRAFKFSWKQKLLTTENDSITFKKLANVTDTTQTINIYNNGPVQLNITSTLNSNSDFTITDTFPITISANSSTNLSLKFIPSVQTKITDTLYVVSKTDEQMVALPIILVGNSDVITSVENETIPTKFKLYQNYPNPFNPSTKISYSLPQRSRILLNIYNVLGEKIDNLIDGIKNSGKYEVNWNAKNYSSGLYFYTIEVQSLDGNLYFKETKKMLLLK